MVRRYRLLTLALAGCAWSAACNTFDDDLEARIPDGGAAAAGGSSGAAGSGGTDGSSGSDGTGGTDGTGGSSGTSGTGGTSDGGSDGSMLLQSADFCEPANLVPTRMADNQFKDVDTTGLRDNFNNLSFCGGINRSLPETDAFFKVDLIAGRRYHFHVKAQPSQNLAVYLLRNCNEQTCVGAIDECPAGTDEHFTFVPTQAGTYFLGIDGISTGPTTVPFTFLATQPTCGNRDTAHGGTDEHSEVCDDGNTSETDDCDNKCRKVLNNADAESEPNGDPYGANVLRTTGNTQVTGRYGGPCDTDFYAVTVPQGAGLTVSVLNQAGATCAGLPASEIRILNSSLVEVARDTGATADAGGCAAITAATPGATNLAAGEYYLAIRATEQVPALNYIMRVAITTP